MLLILFIFPFILPSISPTVDSLPLHIIIVPIPYLVMVINRFFLLCLWKYLCTPDHLPTYTPQIHLYCSPTTPHRSSYHLAIRIFPCHASFPKHTPLRTSNYPPLFNMYFYIIIYTYLLALPMRQIIHPIPLILTPLGMHIHSIPISLIVVPLSFEFISVDMVEYALPIRLVLFPLPLVPSSIWPCLNSKTLPHLTPPLTLVSGATLILKFRPLLFCLVIKML